jgi:hypothetical protein
MATTVQNPLSLDELKNIRATVLAMETEIHNPGAAAARGHDLLPDIEDALYRLADVIERTERLAA